MFLNKNIIPPRFGFIGTEGLAGRDLVIASSVEANLTELHDSSMHLSAAVCLFDLCEAQGSIVGAEIKKMMQEGQSLPDMQGNLWSQWKFTAGREGGLALRNYGKALESLQRLPGTIKEWKSKVDFLAIKKTRKRFDGLFPEVDKLRHAIAHPEFYADEDKVMGATGDIIIPHSGNVVGHSSGGGIATIRNTFFNKHFTSTFEGVVVGYDLTGENAQELMAITKEIYSAFKGVEAYSSSF